jgi:hypothetical protein
MSEELLRMPRTFHFRLATSVEAAISAFSAHHRNAARLVYKGAWASWLEQHREMVDGETERLRQEGYCGDAVDKMYKAGRYYFGRAKLERQESPPLEPREEKEHLPHRYSRLCKPMLLAMDVHILDLLGRPAWSPQRGLLAFLVEARGLLGDEMLRMESGYGMSREAAAEKLKKTYKNRFQKARRKALRASMAACGGISPAQ